MRRFRKEFGLKKARILRERLIPVSQGLKIGINRQPLASEKERKKKWQKESGIPHRKRTATGCRGNTRLRNESG